MEQKTKMFASAILVALVVGSMVGVAAAIEPGVYINGEDVTDQFVEDRSELKGAFTADSSSVRLAELYAQFYLKYLINGCDVDLYYNGSGTTRISITVPTSAEVNAQGERGSPQDKDFQLLIQCHKFLYIFFTPGILLS